MRLPGQGRAQERRFRGEPALELSGGVISAVFTPALGMNGVSLRCRGVEHLALPGGIDALRAGHTTGLPLLAPWANRLAQRRYRAAGVQVDLSRQRLKVDGNGLPIHGLLVGKPGWTVERMTTRGDTARLHASTEIDSRSFPFPHRIDLSVTVRDSRLRIDTTIIPSSRRPVPASFGWHPYLTLPDAPRSSWRLRLPTRRHLALDARGIPTGAAALARREVGPIGRQTFDDLSALGRERRFAIENDAGRSVELRCGTGYSFAQVWVPPGRSFAALEPMVAPTNALVEHKAPLVRRGEPFTASFTLTLDQPA